MVAMSSCSSTKVGPSNKSFALAPTGYQESIEYVVPDGSARKARLKGNVDVTLVGTPFQDAIEPIWIVTQPDGTEPEVNEILFLATDGTHRRLRFDSSYFAVHAQGAGVIITKFEHAKIATEDWKREDQIWFTHPNGSHYRATVETVTRPFPARPRFHITD